MEAFNQFIFSQFHIFQACERAIDVDNDFVTSEFDTSYPQYSLSKDLPSTSVKNGIREAPTTLYELLEYAKTRSILKNNQQSTSTSTSNNGFVVRSMNSVQFSHITNMDSSIKSNKKIAIRISSLKRETKTAQTLRFA